jgi:anti-sigma-K factor RskA
MGYMDSSDKNQQLDRLFLEYRDACEPPELSSNFMPALWQKIEARQSSTWAFRKISGWFVAASAAASAVLALALFAMPSNPSPMYPITYVEALAADHVTDFTLYTEPVHAEHIADYSAGGILE